MEAGKSTQGNVRWEVGDKWLRTASAEYCMKELQLHFPVYDNMGWAGCVVEVVKLKHCIETMRQKGN